MKRLTAFLIALLAAGSLRAVNTGVFVDGGYSPGSAPSPMDELVTGRLNDAERIMKQRDPGARTQRANTKQQFPDIMKVLKGKCGDTITIVMMGHGGKGDFVFTKQN
jgi:hypothetical protein